MALITTGIGNTYSSTFICQLTDEDSDEGGEESEGPSDSGEEEEDHLDGEEDDDEEEEEEEEDDSDGERLWKCRILYSWKIISNGPWYAFSIQGIDLPLEFHIF